MFQLTNRYRYQSAGDVMADMCKGNDPMCDPWDSQEDEKMQFLFLLLFALTF